MYFEFAYFYFALFIWNWNDNYVHTLPLFPRKPYPFSDQNGQSVYPFSDQNGAKTLPDGAAHTYIAYIRGYPPRGRSIARGFRKPSCYREFYFKLNRELQL